MNKANSSCTIVRCWFCHSAHWNCRRATTKPARACSTPKSCVSRATPQNRCCSCRRDIVVTKMSSQKFTGSLARAMWAFARCGSGSRNCADSSRSRNWHRRSLKVFRRRLMKTILELETLKKDPAKVLDEATQSPQYVNHNGVLLVITKADSAIGFFSTWRERAEVLEKFLGKR